MLRDLVRRNRFYIEGDKSFLEIAPCARKALKDCVIKLRGKNNRLIIMAGAQLGHTQIRLEGEGNTVIIRENCHYRSGKIYCKEGVNMTVDIGAGTTVEGAYIYADEGADITIGDDCMLSTDLMIRTGDKHSMLDLATGERTNPSSSIVIGDHVWIARSATVLKGVTINSGSVVAAHSVVAKSTTENNVCVAGNPGREVKKGIAWSRARL